MIALFPNLTSQFLRNPLLAGSCLGLLPGQEWSYVSSDSPGKYGVINLRFLSVDLFIDQLLVPLFQVATETSHACVQSLFSSKSSLLVACPVWLLESFIPCLPAVLCQQQRQGMALAKSWAMKMCSVHTTEVSLTADACFFSWTRLPLTKVALSCCCVTHQRCCWVWLYSSSLSQFLFKTHLCLMLAAACCDPEICKLRFVGVHSMMVRVQMYYFLCWVSCSTCNQQI